jgi:hypothetical protein
MSAIDDDAWQALRALTLAQLVEAMLKHQEMEAIQRYLNTGRVLGKVATVDLEIRWAVAIKRFWSTRTAQAELALDNVSAELRLRNIKPPLAKVQKEFNAIKAESDRDYHELDQRVVDNLADKIVDFMKLLIERKH